MTYDTSLMRVNNRFKKEIEEVMQEREKRGMSKLSQAKITLFITKHKNWNKKKYDLINLQVYEYE